MTFFLCDPGWYAHKPDVQNKWMTTHTHNTHRYQHYYIAIDLGRAPNSLLMIIESKASFLSTRGTIFSWVYKKMFPLRFLEMKLIGQWIQGSYWPMVRVWNVPVRETLIGETLWPVARNCGFKLQLTSNTYTEQRKPRSMAKGLGAGGVEKCKGFHLLVSPRRTLLQAKIHVSPAPPLLQMCVV